MSTTELVNKKVSLLPQEIQLQVLDFVNFLAKKYEVEDDEILLKQFLLQRETQTKKEERVSFNNLKSSVYKK